MLYIKFALISLTLVLYGCNNTIRKEYQSQYVFVIEDDLSLRQTGYYEPRTMFSVALTKLREAGVKSVSPTFYFTKENARTDRQFAEEMKKTPTILQYALKGKGKRKISQRTLAKMAAVGDDSTFEQLPTNEKAEFPARALAGAAWQLGFVDMVEPFEFEQVPMVGNFNGRVVKSLVLTLLEQQYGPAQIESSAIRIAGNLLPLDEQGRYRCEMGRANAMKAMRLTNVLKATNISEMDGKTAVIISEARDISKINRGWFRQISHHQVLSQQLLCVEYDLIEPTS